MNRRSMLQAVICFLPFCQTKSPDSIFKFRIGDCVTTKHWHCEFIITDAERITKIIGPNGKEIKDHRVEGNWYSLQRDYQPLRPPSMVFMAREEDIVKVS